MLRNFWRLLGLQRGLVSQRSRGRWNRTFRPQIEFLEDRVVPAVSQVGSTIAALNNTGWYPPDTGVAAGPTNIGGTSYVVETVNEELGIYNKTTGALVSSENLSTLFSGFYMGSLNAFDPQVMYDDSAGRFVIAAPTTSSTGNGPYTAYIDFAVSKTSDPTQGWTTQQIEVDQGGTNWVDNGKLGYNADAWVYSGNRFGNAGGVMVLSIDKSSIGNSTWTSYLVDESGFSTIPARMHGSAAGDPMWFVESNWSGGSSVTVLKMTNVLSSNPTFTSTSLSTNSYAQSTITQPGGSIGFDCRTLNVEWNNNNLAAAWNSQSGNDAAAFWIEFSTGGVKPAVSEQGTIQPGSGTSTSMPSIAVDAGGEVALSYIQSSASQYPSMYIAGRLANDPANTMTGNTEVQAGNANFSGSRIGDYAGMSLDPSSSNTFWAANEYGLSGVAGNWGTAIAELQITTNSSVAPPTIDSVTASPTTLDGTTGATSSLSVTAHDATAGGSDLSYSWSVFSEPSGVQNPTFSASTSTTTNVTFHAAGTYIIQIAVSNPGGTVSSGTAGEPNNVTITVNQTATSISMSPATASLVDGTSQQFTATELDQFGNAMTSQPGFTWSPNAPNGLFTAPSSGSGGNIKVTASADGLTGTATVSYGTVPAAPSNLKATAVSARQVNLTWTDNSSNETGFIIQRSTNNGSSWVQIATVGVNVTTYSDTTVQKKHTYEYRVIAYNAFGNSSPSNMATITTPTHDPGSTSDDQAVVWVGPSGADESWHRFSVFRQLV